MWRPPPGGIGGHLLSLAGVLTGVVAAAAVVGVAGVAVVAAAVASAFNLVVICQCHNKLRQEEYK